MLSTLKFSVHKLVDEIENEELLETLRDFLNARKNSMPGKLWEELNEQKRQEIILALEESWDETTLISKEEFLNQLK